MRVDVALEPDPALWLELPWQSPAGHYLDIRHNARSIYLIEAARQHPPLGRFLATVNSEDSVFFTASCRTEQSAAGTSGRPHLFSSRITLLFTQEEFNFDARHFAGWVSQLEKLLGRDSPADSLVATVRIGACHFAQLERDGFHLALTLTAEGDSPEQAELRWGLGLVRAQQALLFLSRVVRQHLPSLNR
jgi:hypothetical protein